MKAERFILNSPEGINFWAQRILEPEPKEVGDEVELELDDDEQKQALLAAGWLALPAAAKKKEG